MIIKNGKCLASNIASVHVDGIISAATPNEEGDRLASEFWGYLESEWRGIKLQSGPDYKHLSWNIHQDPRTGEMQKSQRDYRFKVVKASGVEKEHKLPARTNLLESDPTSLSHGRRWHTLERAELISISQCAIFRANSPRRQSKICQIWNIYSAILSDTPSAKLYTTQRPAVAVLHRCFQKNPVAFTPSQDMCDLNGLSSDKNLPNALSV